MRAKFFETDTDTFFDTEIFRNRYRYFFRYQFFSKPIPILFSIPNFFETDTDTFFDTKFFRNQYRYFFRYQNFSKPIPIPSKKMDKFRNREVSKPKCHTLQLSLWRLATFYNFPFPSNPAVSSFPFVSVGDSFILRALWIFCRSSELPPVDTVRECCDTLGLFSKRTKDNAPPSWIAGMCRSQWAVTWSHWGVGGREGEAVDKV